MWWRSQVASLRNLEPAFNWYEYLKVTAREPQLGHKAAQLCWQLSYYTDEVFSSSLPIYYRLIDAAQPSSDVHLGWHATWTSLWAKEEDQILLNPIKSRIFYCKFCTSASCCKSWCFTISIRNEWRSVDCAGLHIGSVLAFECKNTSRTSVARHSSALYVCEYAQWL